MSNEPMALSYESNLREVYPDIVLTNHKYAQGSTDMGNVSHVVPSIHPLFDIGGIGLNHTREFTADSGMW